MAQNNTASAEDQILGCFPNILIFLGISFLVAMIVVRTIT